MFDACSISHLMLYFLARGKQGDINGLYGFSLIHTTFERAFFLSSINIRISFKQIFEICQQFPPSNYPEHCLELMNSEDFPLRCIKVVNLPSALKKNILTLRYINTNSFH